jgi:hypothetical protein
LAEIGSYSFLIVIQDQFKVIAVKELYNVLEVLNKPLPAPSVILSPGLPKTNHDLKCFVNLPPKLTQTNITIIFRWFRNSILQPDFINDNVNNVFTSKYDVWRCEVSLFDGYDEGLPGYAEVFIENSAPWTSQGAVDIELFEDAGKGDGFLLDNYFFDEDLDGLNYTILPTDHLIIEYDSSTRVVYIKPEPNWYGTTTVTIFASDDTTDISKLFNVRVLPLNDAPMITAVGNQVLLNKGDKILKFNALEDEVLKLQISAIDIDGDELSYFTNRTDGKDNDDMKEFSIDRDSGLVIFSASTGMEGRILVNISVQDDRGKSSWTTVDITVLPKTKQPFEQFLLSTNWMLLIIALIIICFGYYSIVIGRKKLREYLKRRYQKKLTGTGRLFANYPMAITTPHKTEPGKYPQNGSEFAAFTDPYRAALYSYKHDTPQNESTGVENTKDAAEKLPPPQPQAEAQRLLPPAAELPSEENK